LGFHEKPERVGALGSVLEAPHPPVPWAGGPRRPGAQAPDSSGASRGVCVIVVIEGEGVTIGGVCARDVGLMADLVLRHLFLQAWFSLIPSCSTRKYK